MMNLREILLLKESFYSCQIEGINEGMTFEQFLKNETVRRSTKNKFKLKGQKKYATRKELAETLEGDNKYVGDFWIPHMRAVCTVFNNTNPNLDKGHKSYPFLFFNYEGLPVISAFNDKEWEFVEKFKI